MSSKNHYSYPWECPCCDNAYRSEDSLIDHQHETNHFESRFCKSCDRGFRSEHHLAQHLRSSVHIGRNITCLFCKAGFTTASGVSHHIETSSCPNAPSANRATVHRMLRQRDTQGNFTENLLEWHHDPFGSSTTLDESWNPSTAWNGRGYECYACHRAFNTPTALKQHVMSPVHQQPLYHCPGASCGKKMVSLAAWLNHLESESCGYMRFANVQKTVGQVLTGRRMIAF